MFCRVLLDNLIRLVLEERWRGEHAGTIPARLARDAQVIGWKTWDITFINNIQILNFWVRRVLALSQTVRRQSVRLCCFLRPLIRS